MLRIDRLGESSACVMRAWHAIAPRKCVANKRKK